MTGIDRLSAIPPLGGSLSPRADARSAAQQAIGEIGHRVLAWVGASVPGGATAGEQAWSRTAGSSDFRPDATELTRRGDVYGLRALAGDVAGRFGGTPTQEGELRRALEDFTRQAVVQVAGLAGGSGERQVQGLTQALDQAAATPTGEGVDGVVARLTAATQSLSTQNG